MLFGSSFKYKTNWWEKLFISGKWYNDIYNWWISCGGVSPFQSNCFRFLPGVLESQHYFLWDPLEDDFKHKELKYNFRQQVPLRKTKSQNFLVFSQLPKQKSFLFYKEAKFNFGYSV